MKEVETEIQKMLANYIIQPSHSPWSTAMLVVKKATCIIICLDYRKLNEITVKYSYTLPRMDDSLDTLREKCVVRYCRFVKWLLSGWHGP